MSFEVAAACKKLQYRGAKREVLMEFADHANDDGICWPSRGRIMYNTGLSESAVKQHTKELREAGVLVVVDHHQGGRGKVPIYKVCPEKGPQKIPFSEWCEARHEPAVKGSKGSSDGSKGVTQTPPEPSRESSSSTEGGQSPTEESLASHTMKAIYRAMKDANFTITRKEYGQQVGRVQWMLDNMAPTGAELEELPATYVRAFTIRGAATDAVYALNEVRRQKARAEVLAESSGPAPWEPINPHSPREIRISPDELQRRRREREEIGRMLAEARGTG